MSKKHLILLLPLCVLAAVILFSIHGMAQNQTASLQPKMVARVWHGKTPASKAEEYTAYLNEAGIEKIKKIPGNLGVQLLRRTSGDITEFTVISYWESRKAIEAFAGADIEKTHNLPRDAEFLLEPEPTVKHFDVMINDWKK